MVNINIQPEIALLIILKILFAIFIYIRMKKTEKEDNKNDI